MSNALRYQIVDEPRPSILSKVALPPLLVFMVATFFQPWGYLLIVLNAIALNGPERTREIVLALVPIPLYFATLALLDAAVWNGVLTVNRAHYIFVAAIGIGVAAAAFAYISQARTFELRRYLAQLTGYAA